MRKPATCLGCPFYGDGDGFVPDELVEGAPIMVVGQNPGEEEEAQSVPFVGATGTYMTRHFFPPAGLVRGQVSIANAYRCRWNHTNQLPELGTIMAREALAHCTSRYFRVPSGTRLIVAQGAYALFLLTGEGLGPNRTISSWRGYAHPFKPAPRPEWSPPTDIWMPGPKDIPVLATLHIAGLFHDMSMYPALQHDWAKVPKILTGKWPRPLPPIGGPEDVTEWPPVIAFDTEYNPETRELHRFSVAGEQDGEVKVWVVEAQDRWMIPSFERVKTAVTQNALADLMYWYELGGRLEQIEDLMLGHSVLWSDMPHDLEFIGSKYAWTNRWKHLMYGNPKVYSGADAFNTLGCWQSVERQLKRDPRSEWIYRNAVLPLIPIIDRAEKAGQRVDKDKAKIIADALRARAQEAKIKAQAVTGWPINVGSPDQVRHEIYDVTKGGRLE